MTVVLRAEHLTRVFGAGETAVTAVADVSLALAPGELVMLRGRSGSGKTTLLNLLGGLDRPTSGRVMLNGLDLADADDDRLAELRRRELAFVFQSFALLPMMSAAENVEVPLRLVGTAPAERATRVAELLEVVGLSRHAAQRPGELSGGQRQRVAIARALANDPAVLIADEPTGQLDSRNGEAMMALIADLVHQRGLAAVVSTHDARLTALADRMLEMTDGRVLEASARR